MSLNCRSNFLRQRTIRRNKAAARAIESGVERVSYSERERERRRNRDWLRDRDGIEPFDWSSDDGA
jgi:hypothetical protein